MYWPEAGKPALPDRAPPRYSQDETETAFLAGAFLDWLGEQPQGEPWCAHLSFLRPHPPFVVPAPFNDLYDPAAGPDFRRAASAAAEAAQHPYLRYWLAPTQAGPFFIVCKRGWWGKGVADGVSIGGRVIIKN